LGKTSAIGFGSETGNLRGGGDAFFILVDGVFLQSLNETDYLVFFQTDDFHIVDFNGAALVVQQSAAAFGTVKNHYIGLCF
jgi:hypothetical protein